jgi:PPOX class probable F420-dependent enzyme
MATDGILAGHAPDEIPASHRDLVECPRVAALTTVMSDGYPQTSVVWCDTEGPVIRVSTMRGFAKERNMRRDPRVTLLCFDPRRPLRYLEVRGTVIEMTEEGAVRHLDELASKYAGRPIRYFGDAIPAHFAETEVPVLCRIRPTHVVAMDGESGANCPPSDPPGASGPEASAPGVPPSPAASPGSAPPPAIPADHLDLLLGPVCAVLTTMGADGQPQSSLVWVDVDGECARVNTTLERQKGRNLGLNPKVSLLVVDPGNTSRFIQVRGDAELVTEDALEHLDMLTRAYTRHPRYYGFVYPVEQQARETRVIVRIHPRRVTLDAIHA